MTDEGGDLLKLLCLFSFWFFAPSSCWKVSALLLFFLCRCWLSLLGSTSKLTLLCDGVVADALPTRIGWAELLVLFGSLPPCEGVGEWSLQEGSLEKESSESEFSESLPLIAFLRCVTIAVALFIVLKPTPFSANAGGGGNGESSISSLSAGDISFASKGISSYRHSSCAWSSSSSCGRKPFEKQVLLDCQQVTRINQLFTITGMGLSLLATSTEQRVPRSLRRAASHR